VVYGLSEGCCCCKSAACRFGCIIRHHGRWMADGREQTVSNKMKCRSPYRRNRNCQQNVIFRFSPSRLLFLLLVPSNKNRSARWKDFDACRLWTLLHIIDTSTTDYRTIHNTTTKSIHDTMSDNNYDGERAPESEAPPQRKRLQVRY
jgi:hypothetical protein